VPTGGSIRAATVSRDRAESDDFVCWTFLAAGPSAEDDTAAETSVLAAHKTSRHVTLSANSFMLVESELNKGAVSVTPILRHSLVGNCRRSPACRPTRSPLARSRCHSWEPSLPAPIEGTGHPNYLSRSKNSTRRVPRGYISYKRTHCNPTFIICRSCTLAQVRPRIRSSPRFEKYLVESQSFSSSPILRTS
jgi:hypothetical protein